jgi:hypothetical protein
MPPTVAQKSSGSTTGSIEDSAVRDAEEKRFHVGAERPFDVVVLSVHVRGDHSPQSDEFRSRAHRSEPVPGKKHPDHLAEREPGLGAQGPRGLVEGEDSVRENRRCDLEAAGRRKRGVSVGAAESSGEDRFSVSLRRSSGDFAPGTECGPTRTAGAFRVAASSCFRNLSRTHRAPCLGGPGW